MNVLAFFLVPLSEAWIQWCVSSLVGTAVVLVTVSLICAALSRKLAPAAISLLFLLVLVKPFVPIKVTVTNFVAHRLPISQDAGLISPESATTDSIPSSQGPFQSSLPTLKAGSVTDAPDGPLADRLVTAESAQMSPRISSSVDSLGWSYLGCMLLVAYLLVLAALLFRFTWSQFRFHCRVRSTDDLPPNALPVNLNQLCILAGLRRLPRVIEMPVASPAVWGITRPTLILPTGLVRQMPAASLRWMVLHELAHLRRCDLCVHAIQRVLLLIQFWNPLAWIASHYVSAFREQACDDQALLWTDRDTIPAGEAFMHVVRAASSKRKMGVVSTSLGVFSSGGKRAIERRLKRLLDTDRRLRDRMGLLAFGLFVALAAVTLPQHRIAQSSPPNVLPPTGESNQANESQPPFVSAERDRTIELVIVDPDGKAVGNADVEIRPRIKTPWKFLKGTLDHVAKYGTHAKADAEGRLQVQLPSQRMTHFKFSIKAPEYGPFWASWETGDKFSLLPARYVAHLDAGVSYGGVIVDETGRPVVGAEVHPSIEYKKRGSDESQLGMGWRTKTDEKGRWRCDFVPLSKRSLSVEIVHNEFAPTRVSLQRSDYRIPLHEEPTKIITVSRGVTLTGQVTNDNGRPVANAKIRVEMLNEIREATTDATGFYRMLGCAIGSEPVVVTAKGYSPEQTLVDFKPGIEPVNFSLHPGHKIRVRVVDEDGNPMQKARVFFKRWRDDQYGKGLDTVHQYTDDNGIWVWNEAPADEFTVTIYPNGCAEIPDQKLLARDEEYLYTATKELTLSGSVTDAESGKRIESFRIIPGMIWTNSQEPHWMRGEGSDGRDGKFQRRFRRADGTHLVRIEAAGYQSAASRPIKVTEGRVGLSFPLQPAQPLRVKITRPDGSPAAGADAIIGVRGTQLHITNGKFASGTFGERCTADADGLIEFDQEADPIRLIVLDRDGFADALIAPGDRLESVSLTAWAKLAGDLWKGKTTASHVKLMLNPDQSQPSPEVPDALWQDAATTDANGSFLFSRVRPGKVHLQRVITTHQASQSSRSSYSHQKIFRLQAGESKTIQYGGGGYRVKGRAQVRLADSIGVDWEFSDLKISADLGPAPKIPYPEVLSEDKRREWYQRWAKTDKGREMTQQLLEYYDTFRSVYRTRISSDGGFEVDGLPSGKYELSIKLDSRPDRGPFNSVSLGSGAISFEISDGPGRSHVIDLGEILITNEQP